MSRFFRLIVMWFIAAALPLQGFAAGAMSCGLAHHQMTTSIASVGGRSAPQASPAHAHEHHAHAAAVDITRVDRAATPPHQGIAAPYAKSKCSACASCCVGAALVPALLRFDTPALAGFAAPAMPGVTAVFMTDGPDRPPRSPLA